MTNGSGAEIYDPTQAEIAAQEVRPTPTLAREAFDAKLWAGIWARLVAQSVDGIIIYIPFAIIGVITVRLASSAQATSDATILAIYAEYLLLFVLYHGLFNSSQAMATWGRRLAGVLVASAGSGERIGMVRGCWRALLSLFCAILIVPNLVQVSTPRRQSVADLLCTTVVLRKGPPGTSRAFAAFLVGIFLLMTVVVAFAVFTLPILQDFTVRTKLNEGLVLAEGAKLAVAENFESVDDAGAAALSRDYLFTPTRYVESITIGDVSDRPIGAIS